MGQGLGRGRRGQVEKAIHSLKSELRASLDHILAERNVLSVEDLIESSTAPVHPRWARVNTIKISVTEALRLFHSPPKHWPVSHQQILEPSVDDLLIDLLCFPPSTDLHDHPLVISGEVILQSKASCMPAHALGPRKGWHVIDCCAAPGELLAISSSPSSITALLPREQDDSCLGPSSKSWWGARSCF